MRALLIFLLALLGVAPVTPETPPADPVGVCASACALKRIRCEVMREDRCKQICATQSPPMGGNVRACVTKYCPAWYDLGCEASERHCQRGCSP